MINRDNLFVSVAEKLRSEFRNSTDELGDYTTGAIRRFAEIHEYLIVETVDELERNPELLEEDFFKLPIGKAFIKRKIYVNMVQDIKYLGLEFLIANEQNITNAVNHMYKLYHDDADLNDLRNPESDWYREILYEFIHLDKDDNE